MKNAWLRGKGRLQNRGIVPRLAAAVTDRFGARSFPAVLMTAGSLLVRASHYRKLRGR